MGSHVYFGFRVSPKELHMAPETLEEQAEFYTKVLGEYVSPEDIVVYRQLRDNWTDPQLDQDMQLAWWKLVDSHPLRNVIGSICSVSYLRRQHGIHLEYDECGSGETTDPILIWRIFNALGFRQEAVSDIDCLYWG